MYKKIILSILITLSLFSISYADSVVLYQMYDGNTMDSSGNGLTNYDYYINFIDDGIKGQAVSFDGTRSYTRISDDPLLSFTTGSADLNFSISCWIKPSKETQQVILAKGYNFNSYHEYFLRFNDGNKLEFRTKDQTNGGYLQVQSLYPLDYYNSMAGWYYIFITKEAGNNPDGLKMYINSVLIPTIDESSGTYTCMRDTTQPIYEGYGYDGSFYRYYGYIDEMKIYDYEADHNYINYSYNLYDVDFFSLVLMSKNLGDNTKNVSVYKNTIYIKTIQYGENIDIQDNNDYSFVIQENIYDDIAHIENIDDIAYNNITYIAYIIIFLGIIALLYRFLRRF